MPRPKEVAMEQRRQSRRFFVHKRVRILFNEGKPPLDCLVFDLTNRGVGLQLPLNIYAPKWFELTFDNFRSRRQCRLAWQHNDKLGVWFS